MKRMRRICVGVLSVTVLLIAVCAALVATSSTDRAVASVAPPTTTSTYDAAAQHLSVTQSDGDRSARESGTAIRGDSNSVGEFSASQPVFVAADTGLSAADQSALDYATTSSKLDHIFAAKHNFDPLVQQYGSREAVVQQFLTGLKGLTPGSGTFEQQIVVGSQKVIVRGAVVNGVTKIGTAYTP